MKPNYAIRNSLPETTDLTMDWRKLLSVSKVKPNYTIQNSLPGPTCDINLSQITLSIHGKTTMLINIWRVFKIVRCCSFPTKYFYTNLYHANTVVPGNEICMCI